MFHETSGDSRCTDLHDSLVVTWGSGFSAFPLVHEMHDRTMKRLPLRVPSGPTHEMHERTMGTHARVRIVGARRTKSTTARWRFAPPTG
jgi:hypothetical protein